jgi:hypothetical protein
VTLGRLSEPAASDEMLERIEMIEERPEVESELAITQC